MRLRKHSKLEVEQVKAEMLNLLKYLTDKVQHGTEEQITKIVDSGDLGSVRVLCGAYGADSIRVKLEFTIQHGRWSFVPEGSEEYDDLG